MVPHVDRSSGPMAKSVSVAPEIVGAAEDLIVATGILRHNLLGTEGVGGTPFLLDSHAYFPAIYEIPIWEDVSLLF